MRVSLFLILILFLTNCDPAYGPVLQNGFRTPVTITVKYADGAKWTASVEPCWRGFVGQSDSFQDRILELSVSENGRDLYRFDQEEVKNFSKIENEHNGRHSWVLREGGAVFVAETNSTMAMGRICE